jgi:hypothetical protein
MTIRFFKCPLPRPEQEWAIVHRFENDAPGTIPGISNAIPNTHNLAFMFVAQSIEITRVPPHINHTQNAEGNAL